MRFAIQQRNKAKSERGRAQKNNHKRIGCPEKSDTLLNCCCWQTTKESIGCTLLVGLLLVVVLFCLVVISWRPTGLHTGPVPVHLMPLNQRTPLYALINSSSLICNMQLNVLNDLAEAMKALDRKNSNSTRVQVNEKPEQSRLLRTPLGLLLGRTKKASPSSRRQPQETKSQKRSSHANPLCGTQFRSILNKMTPELRRRQCLLDCSRFSLEASGSWVYTKR